MTIKLKYEKKRIKELKKKQKLIEDNAVFIEDWEALDKISKESDTQWNQPGY